MFFQNQQTNRTRRCLPSIIWFPVIFSWLETGKWKFLQMVWKFPSFGWGLPQSTSIFYLQSFFLVNYCSIWLTTRIAQTKSHSISLKKKRERERLCLQTPLHERSLFPNSGRLLLTQDHLCFAHSSHDILCWYYSKWV